LEEQSETYTKEKIRVRNKTRNRGFYYLTLSFRGAALQLEQVGDYFPAPLDTFYFSG